MKENLKLAWRNLLRNKRRTMITSASIFFAVFFALILRSFQIGTNNAIIYGVIESFSGFIQIQGVDYFDVPVLDNSIPFNSEIENKILSNHNVNLVVPRIQTYGLASSGEKTKNAIIIGINPEKEIQVNNYNNQLVKIRISSEKLVEAENKKIFPKEIIEKLRAIENNSYSNSENIINDISLSENEQNRYLSEIEFFFSYSGKTFSQNDNSVIIADNLSKFLGIDVGDSLIILSQGYQGVSAVGIFPVKGIIKPIIPELDNSLVYMTLKNAQQLFSLYEVSDKNQDTIFLVSYLSLGVNNKKDDILISTVNEINSDLDSNIYNAVYWKDFNNELLQLTKGDNIAGIILLILLYLVIGFGIFGTVLMMTSERKREFGVMIAVGMQKTRLKIIIIIEMIIIALMGIFGGIFVSIPVILIGSNFPIRLGGDFAIMMEDYNLEPVLPMAWFDTYYINQAIVILIIVIISTLYPIYKIGKLKVINALKT